MLGPERSELADALLSILEASEQPGDAPLYNVVRHVNANFDRERLRQLANRDASPLIEELPLNPRAYNCLKRAHFETAAEVRATPDEHLLAIPNLGKDTLRQIREACRG